MKASNISQNARFVMEWRGPIRNVNVRLPWDLHRAIRKATDTTIEAAYQEALEAWLTAKEGSDSPQKGQGKSLLEFPHPDTAESKGLQETFSAPDHWRLLEMLGKILNSGVGDAIGAVTQNIEVFSKYVEGPQEDTGPSGGKRKKR